MTTLPHEREKSALEDIVDDCLAGLDKFVIIVCPTHSQLMYFVHQVHGYCEGLEQDLSKQIKIFREGVEFDNGAKISFMRRDNPSVLRGVKPDRIVLMGSDAELWYLILTSIKDGRGATVDAVA